MKGSVFRAHAGGCASDVRHLCYIIARCIFDFFDLPISELPVRIWDVGHARL